MFPPYVPPRRRNALEATIPKNGRTSLIVPLIPDKVKEVKYNLPKVKNLYYGDHDTKTQPDLDRNKYMNIMQDTAEVPQ